MFKFIRQKYENFLAKRILKELKTANYPELKHWAMKQKWEALREQDDVKYECYEWYEELLTTLEKVFYKKGEE